MNDFEMSWTGLDHDGDIGVSNNNSEFRDSDRMDFLNEEGLFDNEGHLNQHLINQNSISQDGNEDLLDISFPIPNSINDEEMHGFRRNSASEPINILVNDSQHTTITMSSQSSVRNIIVTTCLSYFLSSLMCRS